MSLKAIPLRKASKQLEESPKVEQVDRDKMEFERTKRESITLETKKPEPKAKSPSPRPEEKPEVGKKLDSEEQPLRMRNLFFLSLASFHNLIPRNYTVLGKGIELHSVESSSLNNKGVCERK